MSIFFFIAVPATAEGAHKSNVEEAMSKAAGPKYTKTKIMEKPGRPVMAAVSGKSMFRRKSFGRV